METTRADLTHVGKRAVFYISGFDPRGAGYYHRIYKTEAAKQAAISGGELEVGCRQRARRDLHAWRVVSRDRQGRSTEGNINFLVWDDIIRRHWASGVPQILRDCLLFIQVYIASGLVFRFARIVKAQLITGLYPAIYVMLATAGALGIAGSIWSTVHLLTGHIFLASVLGLLSGTLAAKAGLWLGDKLAAFWLLRIYTFCARWTRGEIPELDQRIAAFSRDIEAAIRDETNDEILVVGHSVGAILSIPSLSQALTAVGADPAVAGTNRIALLTLGGSIPMVGLQPAAEIYRQHLHHIGTRGDLTWVDVTSTIDGACFPLVDPLVASGIRTSAKAGPRILSARFFKLYSQKTYASLRRRWRAIHFLYLMAGEKTGDYDYFAFTAGPLRMSSRSET